MKNEPPEWYSLIVLCALTAVLAGAFLLMSW